MIEIRALDATYTVPVACKIVEITADNIKNYGLEFFLDEFGYKANLLFPVHADYYNLNEDDAIGIIYHKFAPDFAENIEGEIGDFLVVIGYQNVKVFTAEQMELFGVKYTEAV